MALFIMICLAALAIDQLTKFFVISQMELGESITVIPQIFSITYAANPGGAFRILAHQTPLFIAIGLILVIGVVAALLYLPKKDVKLTLSLGLLTGGVLGNLIDRVRTGYVTDFLDFHVWPVFNFADIFIFIGTVFLLFILIQPQARRR
ncbi:MAG TPA: signal peptidase II [Syntrophomonadaceae bacterium]|nr:signal peptidase II [Syntrophomonadaceae bacterium]